MNGHGSFWAKAKAADTFILLDTVQFSPHSLTCRAPLPDGHSIYQNGYDADHKPYHRKIPYLTVPCKRPHMVAIKDVEIDWRCYRVEKHIRNLRSMRLIQSRVDPFAAALENAQLLQYEKLAEWNWHLIRELCITFNVDMTKFRFASQIMHSYPTKHYDGIGWDSVKTDKGWYEVGDNMAEAWIVGFNMILGATTYLTGPSWVKYARNLREVLNNHGIELKEVKQQP